MKKKITITFVMVLIVCSKLFSQNYNNTELSTYVYNFIKFSTWPDKKTVFTVGFIGSTALETEFKALISKKKNSAITINVKNIKSSDCKTVDVIIVASASSNELKSIQTILDILPILVITEKKDLGRLGACISFFIDEDDEFKTKYQLSTKNFKSKGIIVSEQIINNAVLVR